MPKISIFDYLIEWISFYQDLLRSIALRILVLNVAEKKEGKALHLIVNGFVHNLGLTNLENM